MEKFKIYYRFDKGVESYPLEPSTKGSSGIDLRSAEDVVIGAGERKLVHTGLYLEIPVDYEVQIRPRSGLALHNGLTVLNSPGTIDSDYRNEIGVIMYNTTDNDVSIYRGMRIAQMVVQKVPKLDFVQTDQLSDTERGKGGFGSTGS